MKRSKLLLAGLAIGTFAGVILPPIIASAANLRMYNWMQPPVSTATSNACLTQLWHGAQDAPNRALDWKATCGASGDETVFFRSRTAAPDDCVGCSFVGARGEPSDEPDIFCGGGALEYVWVRVRATADGENKGVVTYQHMNPSSTTAFDIWFNGGTSFSTARLNERSIGTTTDDPGTCHNGWHVHENNRNTVLWDLWNTSYYNSSADLCDCHRPNLAGTWTRRLHWIDVFP